jgi:predicted metal-dependent peptidase
MATKFSKLEKAKSQLVLSHPFFASILLRGKLVERKDIPTAAVDARGTIYYNHDFFEKELEIQEVVFVLAHECMHKILHHFARLGGRNPQKANYAQDACINDILQSSGVGKMPSGAVNMPGSKDKTWEEVYAELPEQPKGKEYMDGVGIGHDILPGGESLTQAELSEIAAAVKVEMAQAAQAARMQGKMPEHLQRFVDDILYVRTPWFTILERYMTSLTKSDYSWAKPNKRYAGQGIHLPSIASEPTMGEIVLVVDTSGSIGARELAECQAHLNRILETCHPEKVHLVYCDSAVNKTVEVLPQDMPFKLEAVGGGGTDMMEALHWVGKQGLEPAVIVVLTDGHTPFDGPQPDAPVIWLITSDVKAPFGETIKFEG